MSLLVKHTSSPVPLLDEVHVTRKHVCLFVMKMVNWCHRDRSHCNSNGYKFRCHFPGSFQVPAPWEQIKAAIVTIFILKMSHVTTCMQKRLLLVLNPQRNSAAPLGFTELDSDFQLIVQLFRLQLSCFVHSHRSHNYQQDAVFSKKALKNNCKPPAQP